MWFRNLQVYRFTRQVEYTVEELGRQLAEHAFQPCGSQDVASYGWVPPLGRHGSEFVHAVGNCVMLCARRQEKLLPPAVVNEVVEEQVAAIESGEGRRVGRKERAALKEDAIFTLLPRAFHRSALQYAYIALDEGLLVVDAASLRRAEQLLDCLRDTLGSLPLAPLGVKGDPVQRMTGWLRQGRLPAGFRLGHECELRDALDESSVIRARHQDLASDEINRHLQAGMLATRLGLEWEERLSFVVEDKLAIKRLDFGDVVRQQAEAADGDDAVAVFDQDFAVMSLELNAFIAALVEAFGGEDVAAG